MKVEPMQKIRICVPKSNAHKVINALYNLNVFHTKKYERGKLSGLDTASPLDNADDLSKLLLQLREVKEFLNLKNGARPDDFPEMEDVEKSVEKLHKDVTLLQNDLSEVEKELSEATKKEAIVKALEKLNLNQLSKVRLLDYFAGSVGDIELVKKQFEEMSHDIAFEVHKDHTFFILFVKKKDGEKAQRMLEEIGVEPVLLNDYKGLKSAQLKKEIAKLKQKEKKLELEKEKLAKENEQLFLKEIYIQEEIRKVELPLEFATTDTTFIAQGYVPKKDAIRVEQVLTNVTSGSLYVDIKEVEVKEPVPIKLRNTKAVKNFEFLSKLYDLPSYKELDPSFLLFLTFPLFFGIMLGDVIYGLIIFSIITFLRKKFPQAKPFFNVLMISALWSVLFGFAFGEYLGFEHVGVETGEKWCDLGLCLHKGIIEHHGESVIVYEFPRLMHRMGDMTNLFGYTLPSVLVMGLLIGIFHVNFGWLLGFYNELKMHGLKQAFFGKVSWFVLQGGIAIIILSATNKIILPVWSGLLVIVLAIIMLYIGEGIEGAVEVTSIISNTFSYMRLGALGIASAGLAIVINDELAKPLIQSGTVGAIFGIFVMILGHAINIKLGVIGPFMHSLRLHYVEFFSKFYKGGGQEYKPFGYKEV